MAASWNAWVRAQRKAAVAGVALEIITPWGEPSRYVAVDAAVVAQELTERSTLLAQLNGLSLHDDDQQLGAFKKAGTLGGRSYAQAAARWRAAFETFWYEARWLEGAIAATARRYLGGEPLLFPEDTERRPGRSGPCARWGVYSMSMWRRRCSSSLRPTRWLNWETTTPSPN